MKKIKLKKANWRKLVKNALMSTLVLAAIALCYGYYLVEKIGDNYKEAQMAANSVVVSDTQQMVLPVTENVPIDDAVIAEKVNSMNEKPISEEKIQPEINDFADKESGSAQAQSVVHYQSVGSVAAVTITPCRDKAIYEYGYGYDPVYKDIRFHDHALYQANEDFEILAVDDGLIEEVGSKDNGWFVRICHEWGISEYRGLNDCALTSGQSIYKGEKIATSSTLYYYLYAKEDSLN